MKGRARTRNNLRRRAYESHIGQSIRSKGKALPADLLSGEQIRRAVEEVLESTPFIDIHTHLFSPAFGKLGLWESMNS